MAYVGSQSSSLNGQQYHLHHLHHQAQPQRPAILAFPVSDESSDGTESEGSQNKKLLLLSTNAWRLKLRQQTMTQTQTQNQQQQQCHQQHSKSHLMHMNPKPHYNLINENDGHDQNHDVLDQDLITPAALAYNLLKTFGPPSSNRGKSATTTTFTVSATENLKKSIERALESSEDDDPAKWTIQTLFEIEICCTQQTKTVKYHEDVEQRASQFVIDAFHSYMNKWTWEYNASSENGTMIHNNIIESSDKNMHARACSTEQTRDDLDKNKNNGDDGDLNSWDEHKKESLNVCMQILVQKKNEPESKLRIERPRPVTQTHRQMLLDAILEGRNTLQVFLAIDTFELSDSLSILPPKNDIDHNSINTGNGDGPNRHCDQNTSGKENEQQSSDSYGSDYGSLLTINLIQRGHLHAATQLLSRLQHNRHQLLIHEQHRKENQVRDHDNKGVTSVTSLQQLLANRLLDKGHPDLIHLFVNTDRELCRTILQMIDYRFAGQIWTWIKGEVLDSSLLDPFLVVQCRAQTSSSSPASSSTTEAALLANCPLPVLLDMLETANSLGMSFGLENTMKSFRSIQFIQEYCTVLFLLLTNNRNPSYCSYHQNYHKQKSHATTTQENALSLTPWMFLPSVLPILKGNPALQRLVVWTFAAREDGIATAEFLASTLGLGAFFAQCVGKNNEEEDNDAQKRDDEKNDQTHYDNGAKKEALLLEQPLIQVQGQSVEQSKNHQVESSKKTEKYDTNIDNEKVAVTKVNRDDSKAVHSPDELYKTVSPLLTTSIARMSQLDVNNNTVMIHSNGLSGNAFTRPMPTPLQTKPSSAPSSAPVLQRAQPTMALLKQMKHLPTHRRHTTSTATTSSTTVSTTNKKQSCQSRHTLDYKPSPGTTIILLNQMSQLQQLYDSLFTSDVVGMSLIRPLAKPWANFKNHPEKLQQQQLLQQYQQQLLQQQKQLEAKKKNNGGGSNGGCAYLQLACSSDKRVYVIDLEVFLDEEMDPLHKFPRLI
ncbi:hypothetical protein BG015_003051, partial [Linnemannia schmuckeri]